MIRQFELVERVRDYNPHADEALINRAYVYGAKAHAHQTRASGEPYFGHPLEVASILTDLRLDDATIVTALLHDTLEDTEATHEEITRLFGAEICELVDGVTKLSKLELSSTIESAQAANLRKLLVAMARDVRVLLVKLADRLHNMRTLGALKPEKRQRIARETMEIYAPLAGRMGMQKMREELEDLAFEHLHPEARTSIMRRFLKLRKETGNMIPEIEADIAVVLRDGGLPAMVRGREKRPYSIWRKMEEKQISFSQLSDIYAFRIFVGDEEACYRALGAIHRRWKAVPGRFKDYISAPKANGYRSLHTTVFGKGAMRVEMQIRTPQMHEIAESGVAAHWSYRDGERVENPFVVDPFRWLRTLVDRMEKGDEPAEFLEHVKLDMFVDQVFCFTPKGEVIGLPRGATPIDFAYAIHTRVGDHCAGAKVDGQRVPLWTRLRNGQQVEIITAEGQSPAPVWEELARTGRAKSAIRRALRERFREERIALGRDIAAQAFARVRKEGGPKALEAAARKLGRGSAEKLLAALGAGELTGRAVVAAVYPDPGIASAEEATGPAVPVMGLRRGETHRFCPTCWPIPGDRIVGLAAAGGVTVHAISCPELARHETDLDRWLDLKWDPEADRTAAHVVRIELTIANEPGTMGAVCTLIGEQLANIDNFAIVKRRPDFFEIVMDLEVRDLKHLSAIVTSLQAQTYVSSARRHVEIQPEGSPLPATPPDSVRDGRKGGAAATA